ncbi:TRAP transporter substrate-binding protein [Pelagibius sp. CAU 1746]|uniref:TRAP transporter substrate-binding protein n=1 Tax=Pelagibius sp. CAU 1746 TaxID=3140370 RepID=UPI00325A8E03
MDVTRKGLVSVALAAAASLAIGMGTQGLAEAAPKQITVGSIYSIDKPQGQVWLKMQDLVEKEAPGKLKFNVVPDGALGGEKEEVEGVRLGSLQAGISTLANMTTWVPAAALFDMPFMFRDQAHIDAVMAGPVGDRFKSLFAEQGFKAFGFITYGSRNVISKEAITGPADVDGKKMRVLQSPLHIALWDSLGASPTPIPITESYNALETGVVDFMDMTMSGYNALKLYEVVPAFSRTSHIWSLGVMYMSQSFWDSLDAEEQAALEAAAAEAIPYFNQLAAAEQEAALQQAIKGGAKVIEQDIAEWQAAMAPFWASYADNVGGMSMIEAIVETK